MPSLEILDISRNKIKRLPSQPGSLINLRVGLNCLSGVAFSLARILFPRRNGLENPSLSSKSLVLVPLPRFKRARGSNAAYGMTDAFVDVPRAFVYATPNLRAKHTNRVLHSRSVTVLDMRNATQYRFAVLLTYLTLLPVFRFFRSCATAFTDYLPTLHNSVI